ncbi:MAG: tetratricopeptide repeat protein [Candidatus Competibacteraceae bacterium]|nr:tetratricopeptide repeat protein [Candidatus Competibacteraceae bacterium]
MRFVIFIFFVIIMFGFPVKSFSSEIDCGPLLGVGYGPFDYNEPEARGQPLHLVESAHFTPEVETLIRGNTSGTPLGDLDYTLRAFPNHHRALYSLTKYELREKKKSQQAGIPYTPPQSKAKFPATAECYFDRAIRWRPDDPTVRLLYGLYLQLTGKLDQALAQYKLSEKIQPKSADLNYNMGLLYFDLKQYSLAKQYAQKAYQLGYPLPGLRKKLAGVGQWP